MIFTYLIHYEKIDDFDEIEFCAETRKEAIELFNEWCVLDNDMLEPKKMISIELIYNEEDSREYGKNYGLCT